MDDPIAIVTFIFKGKEAIHSVASYCHFDFLNCIPRCSLKVEAQHLVNSLVSNYAAFS